jgi:aldehyde:ferredoxin oxidoreductase
MRALIVDLTHMTCSWKPINPSAVQKYLGGRGLGVRYLYDHLIPGVDALSPENILSFWASPIMSTGAISTVKLCGVTKSPLTNTILMSLMGGYFGPRMRMAEADAVIFIGKAPEPVYLLIDEGKASLRPAKTLWGKNTRETTAQIRAEVGSKNIEVACIGVAGENLVLFASIMNGGDAMGRGGIGAVMGSKNLKAVAVHGNHPVEMAHPELLKETIKRVAGVYQRSLFVKEFGKYGTTSHVDDENYFGIYPTRNYQSGKFESYESVNHEELYGKYVNRRVTCFTCAVRCRRESQVKDGPLAGKPTEGPEYETLWSFGGNCENKNLEAIIVANELCLDYGLDTISTGMVISFIMECFEGGLIPENMLLGLDLQFGNPDTILDLINRIARREGIGNLLAQGTRKAAQQLGPEAGYYAMQVKGLELAGYDPRGAKGMGLGYATSPRGGCHERGFLPGEVFGAKPVINRFSYEGKGKLVQVTQDMVAVKDALGFCVLSSAGTSMDDLAAMFSAASGFDASSADLATAGERICNLERLFNLREGFTRADDNLPQRLLKEPIPGPNGTNEVVDLERLLDDYYLQRGWDSSGCPTSDTLQRLELSAESAEIQVLLE